MKKNDTKIVTGELLRQMLISGGNNLFNHYPEIDVLNVFPVPDGDTGTNMNLSITSGIKEILNITNNHIGEVGKLFSRGLLMGARGNSGVILSQIFRGFSKYIVEKELITVEELANAFVNAKEVAYKAVMKPVEGTILTVIRESSDVLKQKVTTNTTVSEAMQIIYDASLVSLAHTPELLPVLKEVGVVDSGGAGLTKIFEGMLSAANGEVIERKQVSVSIGKEANCSTTTGYNLQFILKKKAEVGNKQFDEEAFAKNVTSHGKNALVQHKDNFIKVSMEADRPGMVLNGAQNYGEFISLEIKPINEPEKLDEHYFDVKAEPVEIALISTSVGKGLDELFKSLNVTHIVSGGQTMNPSTEDFVEAVEKVNAKNVIILPNNKNILMAAQQAAEVITTCNVQVIPSKTIMQGIVASMMFVPEADLDSNLRDMNNAIRSIKSGQVTFSIKDTRIDDVDITKDHFMGICDGKILCCLENKHKSCKQLISQMVDKDSSIVTIIYGEDVKEEEAQSIADFVANEYGVDVEVHQGDQPVYSYFIGVE